MILQIFYLLTYNQKQSSYRQSRAKASHNVSSCGDPKQT